MKIRSVEAHWVHIPIPPERQHTSDFGKTLSFDGTIVRIDTECGITGWGEAKAQVGGMAQNQALTTMINDEFAPLLKGEDPRDITRLWELLYSGARGHYALSQGRVFPVLGRRGITVSAISPAKPPPSTTIRAMTASKQFCPKTYVRTGAVARAKIDRNKRAKGHAPAPFAPRRKTGIEDAPEHRSGIISPA